MRAFFHRTHNFGDTLTQPLLENLLGVAVQFVPREETGKVVAVGSILPAVRENDIVWGTGTNMEMHLVQPKGSQFLAVRGPLTRAMIEGTVPEVYGDPALLLPLIYSKNAYSGAKLYKRGIIPHYIDKKAHPTLEDGDHLIDVLRPWPEVVDEILRCEAVVSSSLHGIVVAEAYGIPATWAVWSSKVIGGPLKFHDYFLGTGREAYEPGEALPPIPELAARQQMLLQALHSCFPMKYAVE